MFDTRLYIPQARQARPHRIKLGLRQGRRRAARGPERGRGIQRRAGDGLPGRIALVEQGRDLRLIEGPLLLRLRRLRRRGLGFRLRHRLFCVFRLQGLCDRIVFGRIRLLLDGLRLVLGLVLGDRFWRIGLFLDRLFHRLRRRFRRRGGYDFLLFGNFTDGVFDRSGIGDFLDQRLRLVLFAGLDAGGDLGELIGGDDIDRHRFRRRRFERPRRKGYQPPPDHEEVERDRRNECLVDFHFPPIPDPLPSPPLPPQLPPPTPPPSPSSPYPT